MQLKNCKCICSLSEQQLLYFVWLLTSLIMNWCYQGLVFASLSKDYPKYYATFEQIERNPKLRPFVINDSWKKITYMYLNDSFPVLFRLAGRYLNLKFAKKSVLLQNCEQVSCILSNNIPLVAHESYNRKFQQIFHPLPLTLGDEKIFLTLLTRYQLNSTSLFRKEIYSCLAVPISKSDFITQLREAEAFWKKFNERLHSANAERVRLFGSA